MECISVSLGDRSYDIEISAGLLASERAGDVIATFAPGKRVCLVTHPGLKEAYALPIARQLEARNIAALIVTIPPGEHTKNLRTVSRLYSLFVEAKLDRKSLVVAVGGGVLGDMVGFAAASYLRGIEFVQAPTTLLAQVDASVGGKTGVDLPQGKNLVGAFHQPRAVLIDTETLRTLPRRELRAGLAEVIKYGIIYDDDFFAVIAANIPGLMRRESAVLTKVIARSCAIKAQVVAQDETEQGLRAILNFGHTIGHALEAVTRYRRYKHGEAISIGMVAACLIGEEVSVTPPQVTEEVRRVLELAGLPTVFPDDVSVDAILEAAQRDKKTLAGRLRFVLATRLGEVRITDDVPVSAVHAALARQQITKSAGRSG